MKVMIVNAFGRSNRGDSVLLDECIAEVRAALPDAKISCSIFEGVAAAQAAHPDVTWSERIGNSTSKGMLSKLTMLWRMAVSGLAVLPGFGWAKNMLPSSQRESWKNIREADVVISAPGGYIHDTNFAYYVALFHIALARKTARNILAPQSIGPIDSPIARSMARTVLKKTDAVCARESYTWDFLRNELNLPDEILRRSGDSAFWNHDVTKNDKPIQDAWKEIGLDPHEGGPILGLTVVDWTFPKSTNPAADQDTYVASVAKIIDHMHNKHGMRAVIFNQVSSDLVMSERVVAASSSPIAIDKVSREPDVLRALISTSTLFLGTRFHSCIFAMMAYRPTFAIAYLPKTSYILRDLKLDQRQIPITELDPDAVIAALEHDLSDVSAAEGEIKAAVSVYQRTYTQLRDVLVEVA